MQTLEQLYGLLQNPICHSVTEITNAILSIYLNSESILEILRILSSNSSPFIKQQAAIGLSQVISRHWQNIMGSQQAAEEIKAAILNLLHEEADPLVQNSIIYAIEKLLQKTCELFGEDSPHTIAELWPQLFDFLQVLFSQENQRSHQVGLELLSVMVPMLGEQAFNSNLPQFINQIMISLTSPDEDYLLSGLGLFVSLNLWIDDNNLQLIQPNYSSIVEKYFVIFHQSLLSGRNCTYKIANHLSSFISSYQNSAIPISQLLLYLINMLNDPNIQPTLHYFIYLPLIEIIQNFTDDVKPHIELLIETIFKSLAIGFTDECYQENSSACFISTSIEYLCYRFNGEKLFPIVSRFLSDDSPNSTFASILILDKFIYNAPNTTISQSSTFAKFFINHLTPNNHHSIREVSLISLQKFISFMSIGLNDFFQPIIEGCICAIDSNDVELIYQGIKTLNFAIQYIEYDDKFNGPIFEKLFSMLQVNSPYVNEIFEAISMLVEVAEDDISIYVPQLMPYLLQSIQIDDNMNPILKGISFEIISKIIKILPNETQQISEQYIALLIQNTSSKDTFIVSHLLKSFTNLVNIKHPLIQNILIKIAEYAVNELDCSHILSDIQNNENFQNEDNVNDESQQSILLDTIINSTKLIRSIINNFPIVFQSNIEQIIIKMKSFSYIPLINIIKQSLKTLAAIFITYQIDPNPHMEEIKSIFELHEASLSEQAFIFYTKMIYKYSNTLSQDIYKIAFSYSIAAINNELPCLQEDEFGGDEDNSAKVSLMMHVFDCLTGIALNVPQYFDKGKFIQLLQKLLKENRIQEILLGVSILGKLFKVAANEISGLILKFMIKIILETLKYCDGTNQPFPIIALRDILETNPNVLANYINGIFQKIDEILQLENVGQPYYHQTVAAVVSLLFSFLKIQKEQFPLQKYLNVMVSVLPEKIEAENIYSSIIIVYEQFPQALSQVIPQIIVGFAKTLALKDSKLKSYGFSDALLIKIVGTLRSILSAFPDGMALIQQSITDQKSLLRLNQRVFQ